MTHSSVHKILPYLGGLHDEALKHLDLFSKLVCTVTARCICHTQQQYWIYAAINVAFLSEDKTSELACTVLHSVVFCHKLRLASVALA